MGSTEQDIIERARAGDPIAIDAMFGDLIDPAFRLAFALLHDRQAAEDAVQEAALSAWRRLDSLRPGSRARPWFLAFVANHCRNARRARWRSVLHADGLEGTTAGIEDRVVYGAEVRRAIGMLSRDQRTAVVLHLCLDLPLDEVAAITGVPLGTVKSRIHRASARLRAQLASEEVMT
jgi:RNA polymerase sigma factor (sigma-70 family)